MSYIPKEYYPSVMFARKLMREGEDVGLAVYKAAKYYGTSVSNVASWLNGKKKAKKQAPKKYCWYVVEAETEASCGERSVYRHGVEKCDHRINFRNRIYRECENMSRRNDTGSIYSPFFMGTVSPKLYNTEKEAREALSCYLQGVEVK